MSDEKLFKYPRTYHIKGSRLQPGDHNLKAIRFKQIRGRYLVIEEKMDGANAAVSFSTNGQLRLQSRGHYLMGGRREKHFNLFKQWGYTHAHLLWPVLRDRYVMYGEWLYARHTIFYNRLPHYFMEFDMLDKTTGEFLSTKHRQELLAGLPIVSVKVLVEGYFERLETLIALIGPSHFIEGNHIAVLQRLARELGLDAERATRETDPQTTMEGLYIKVEEDGLVQERYKFIRASFLTAVLQSDSHWLSRPIIPNQLEAGVDIFKAGKHG